MRDFLARVALALVLSVTGVATVANDDLGAIETVDLETHLGTITIELYVDRAPLSSGSFLDYLDKGLMNEAVFYRVVTHENDNGSPLISVVQGGLLDEEKMLPPVAHETTEATGLSHVDGAVSIARAEPGTGSAGAFFISIGDNPSLDYGGTRNPDQQGFAVFGQVVAGMDVVRAIQQLPADLPTDNDYMKGQLLGEPVEIISARRLAQDAEEPLVPTTVEELLAAISDKMDEHDVPAIGLALADTSGPVWVGSLGKADLATDRDADADTIFRIGSTSKMFVALSVLQLVEEGRLSLDDKVADLVPEIEFENRWEDTDPIRIVHLLEHTTGWDDFHLPEYAHNDPTPATLKEGLDYHPHSRISRWKPGTRSSYCNAGPPVAAYIIEKITGQDFEDYVAENFFAPLQMDSATYQLTEDVEEHGATLYTEGVAENYWHIITRPSGAINASPKDMGRFLQLFLGRGTVDGVRYVRPESIDRMERAETTNAARRGLEAGYGLHNYTSAHKNWVYRAHNGGMAGGLTEFAYLPEAGVGYAFMINSGSGAAYGEISDLIRDFQTRELPLPDVPTAAPVTEADRDVAGLYEPINPRQQIGQFLERVFGVQRLWFEGDELQRKPLLGGDTSKYLSAGNGLYRSPETAMIVLARAEDPMAGDVVHVGNLVMKPVSTLVVYGQLAVGVLWGLVIASSFLYFLVWGVRKLRGKVPAGPSTRIRVWPLLAGVSIVVFMLLLSLGANDITSTFEKLGAPTPLSISVMLVSIAFAVFAALGLYTAVKYREAEMNRWNYWYCSLSSAVHVTVALYLAWFGIVGVQTWA